MGYGYGLMVECLPSMHILGYSIPSYKNNNRTTHTHTEEKEHQEV